MSRTEEKPCCPECQSIAIRTKQADKSGPGRMPKYHTKYACQSCNAHFDEPDTVEVFYRGSGSLEISDLLDIEYQSEV